MPTSTTPSPISAAAAPIHACAPAFTAPRPRSPPSRRREEAAMTINIPLSRRQFIIAATALGGGLALGCHYDEPTAAASAAPAEFNPWLVINPDNSVIIRVTTPEI